MDGPRPAPGRIARAARRGGDLPRTRPVRAPATGRPQRVGDAVGRAGEGVLTWPLAGRYARVRGDLSRTELTAIARGTTVSGGRPRVRPPDGLAVVGTVPYRPPHVRETRYGGSELPGDLGGLVYTGVATCGGFEDRLYATRHHDAGRVRGRRAVVSDVGGGNGTLAWEAARPGHIAYVGYSGAELNTAVLRTLADHATAVGARQWRSAGPHVIGQVNDFS